MFSDVFDHHLDVNSSAEFKCLLQEELDKKDDFEVSDLKLSIIMDL